MKVHDSLKNYHYRVLTKSSADVDKPAQRVWRPLKDIKRGTFCMLGMVSYYLQVCKTQCFWDIRFQKCRDLENRVRCLSWSLEMSPCDRAHMTTYWRSTVTYNVSISCRFWDIQCWKISTLKSRSRVSQGNWKWYHSIDCVWFPYSNFFPKFFRYSTYKCTVTLKPGLGVTQGYQNRLYGIDPPVTSY